MISFSKHFDGKFYDHKEAKSLSVVASVINNSSDLFAILAELNDAAGVIIISIGYCGIGNTEISCTSHFSCLRK